MGGIVRRNHMANRIRRPSDRFRQIAKRRENWIIRAWIVRPEATGNFGDAE